VAISVFFPSKDDGRRLTHFILQTPEVPDIEQLAIYGAAVSAVTAVQDPVADIRVGVEPVQISGRRVDHVVVRTNVADRQRREELKALIEGCASVIKREHAENQWTETELYAQADLIAHDTAAQYALKPESLRQAFTAFVAEPSGRVQRDEFVAELFRATWGLDIDAVLEQGLGVEDLLRVASELGFEPPDGGDGWYSMSAEQVFDTHREIDPRRLSDPDVRRSDEGQRMERAYTQLFGEIRYEQYHRQRDGSEEHEHQPLIPLAEVPLIEGFFIAAVGTDHFTELSSRPLVTLVLQSTSLSARQAFIDSVIRRFPEGGRASFHAETEFQFKKEQIAQLLSQYQRSIPNNNHRALHLNDLIPVVAAFTGSGPVIEDMRSHGASGDARADRNLADFKEITKLLLTEGLSAPDGELTQLLEAEVTRLFGFPQSDAVEPWSLTRSEAVLVWFDALEKVSIHSKEEVVTRVGREIFAPYGVWSNKHNSLVQHLVNGDLLERHPEVRAAFEALQEARESGAGPSAVEAAEGAYNAAMFRSRLSKSMAAEQKNALVFALLDAASSDLISTPPGSPAAVAAGKFFAGLVSNIALPEHAPAEVNRRDYARLIRIARRPDLPAHLQAAICFRIQKHVSALPPDQMYFKRQAALDMFGIAFGGPPGAAEIESLQLVYLLRPATMIIREAGLAFFDGMSPNIITQFGKYADSVRDFARKTTSTPGVSPEVRAEFDNGQSAVRLIDFIGERYAEYLHIAAVKREPAEYQAWFVSRLERVTHALDVELSLRGERDQPSELVELRDLVRAFVERQSAGGGTPADGKLLKETGLGTFLAEFCQRIHPVEATLSSRGWEFQCLDFKREAVEYLPPLLIEQFQRRVANQSPLGQALVAQAGIRARAAAPPGPALA
jgi:hypothetical protein